ncbi:MAG: N-succinylarginine dihydrolase [Verrucomicrobiota bacterium]
MYQEINFDGLVGPTHNYAGLSVGNIASLAHRNATSRPKTAALQGLKKMKMLADLGIPQAVLPPLERPSIPCLRRFGIDGKKDADVLRSASQTAPELLVAASSASSMWTANAATMVPSCDTADGKVHFTPANLSSKLHRAIEADETARALRTIFSDTSKFSVHSPLEGGQAMSDEGAANHTRFAPSFSSKGLHLFVFGASSLKSDLPAPRKFPARQTLEASQAIARLHKLDTTDVLFLQQSNEAIDAGVFHNDVISVGHLSTYLYHEKTFQTGKAAIDQIASSFQGNLDAIEVVDEEVSLEDAVSSYLFNSQIVSLPNGKLAIFAPSECREVESVHLFLQRIQSCSSNQIEEIHFLDLKESMRNGGGPACLRQRVVMNQEEITALSGRIIIDDELFSELEAWIKQHYRDELSREDLSDPKFLEETRTALDKLTRILKLGNLYDFQNK